MGLTSHALITAVMTSFPVFASAQCGVWLPTSVPVGTDSTIYELLTDDPDGPGPAPERLLVAGGFTTAGLETGVRSIAAWDGASWSTLGTAPGGTLFAMVRHDPDGPAGPQPSFLAVAGDFFLGTGLEGVAKWDGAQWQVLTGLIGRSELAGIAPSALGEWDPDGPGPATPLLIAGGNFTASRGSAGNGIAFWDGTWGFLGDGVGGRVSAITSWDPDGPGPALPRLIAAGSFSTASGLPARNIAQWDGVAWSALADGYPSGEVSNVMVWDPDQGGPALPLLLAIGRSLGVRAWDGTVWVTLPGTMDQINSMAEFDPDGPGPAAPDLYVGGKFMYRWNGTSFIQIADCGRSILADIRGMAAFGAHLYAGGTFDELEGLAPERIARWDGASWSTLTPTTAADNGVDTMALYDGDGAGPGLPIAVAAGRFTAIGGKDISRIAMWDGADWSPIGPGLSRASGLSQVRDVAVHDPDGPGPIAPWLVAGGRFDRAGSTVIANIAAWDGSAWQPLGLTINEDVYSVVSHDADGPGPGLPELYAGGSGFLSRWDGSAWQPVASFPGICYLLTSYDEDDAGPALPRLLMATGTTTRRVYEVTGTSLTQFGPDLAGTPAVICGFDPDAAGPLPKELLVGGNFLRAEEGRDFGVMRWDGEAWRAVLDGPDENVSAMDIFDPDGAGPQPAILAAVGSFRTLGTTGISIRGVAGWSGGAWFPIGSGSSTTVISCLSFDPDEAGPAAPQLLAGGIFVAMDGLPALRFCPWEGAVAPYATAQPGDVQVAPGDPITLSVTATAISGSLTYRWSKDGMALTDGGNVSGAMSDTLVITPAGAYDSGVYTCRFEDDCNFNGTIPSRVLVLCPSDINRDGLVDFVDYLDYLTLYDAQDLRADLTGDGEVSFADYLEFLNRFDAAC